MRIEKQNIPSRQRNSVNVRFRNFESDIDAAKRKLKSFSDDRSALFGERYSDMAPSDLVLNQRQQLLSGTERLQRSSGRLMESQRIANETEAVGANTLANLQGQRETILHTRETLLQSETQVERSVKTLRGMARRYLIPRCPLSTTGRAMAILANT
jgi:vesicle transport through interaction with t-SNAREs 1